MECLIKGNISKSTGDKIYHLPDGDYYEITTIETETGEKYFCSEEEAKDAGWRKSGSAMDNQYVNMFYIVLFVLSLITAYFLYKIFFLNKKKIQVVKKTEKIKTDIAVLEEKKIQVAKKTEKIKTGIAVLEEKKIQVVKKTEKIKTGIAVLEEKINKESNKWGGYEFEQKFAKSIKKEGIILQYVDQNKESIKLYNSGKYRVKRPDFFVMNSGKFVYLELKNYKLLYDSFSKRAYYLFRYSELKGLERFLAETKSEDIYVLFLDNSKEFLFKNIKGISILDIKKNVYNKKFPVLKKKYIRVFVNNLVSFEIIKTKIM